MTNPHEDDHLDGADDHPLDGDPEAQKDERVGQYVAVAVLAAVAVGLMLLMATGVIDFPLV